MLLFRMGTHSEMHGGGAGNLPATGFLPGNPKNSGPLSNAGMKGLKKLKSLTTLNLYGFNLTDEGMKELTSLKNLKILNLDKTRVTNAGVAGLQKALPELKVRGRNPCTRSRRARETRRAAGSTRRLRSR
jgi:hypothetical protein